MALVDWVTGLPGYCGAAATHQAYVRGREWPSVVRDTFAMTAVVTTRTPPDPQSLEMAAKRLWQNFELQLTIEWFGEAAKSVDESSSLTGAPGDNSTAALAAAIAATGEIPPTIVWKTP